MIALFNILVTQKRGISIKEKQTAQPRNVRESYSHQNTQIHALKRKIFFISMKVKLITISSVIPYISEINSASSSLKKKKRKEERLRKGEEKRKKGRKNEKKKEKEKKEEKEKEEEKMEKAILKVHRSLQTHSLARS